jgi:hypothetical protein
MQSENQDKKTFCQICRHPSDEGEGHYKNCPVYTGETIASNPAIHQELFLDQNQLAQQMAQGGLASYGGLASKNDNLYTGQCPYCGGRDGMHYWAGTGQCPATWNQTTMIRQGQIPTQDGYEVAKIYREARERILEELKIQVEVNRRMAREIIDLRLEIQNLKGIKD